MTIKSTQATLSAVCACLFSGLALADFVTDAKGDLELRNFYYNRDLRDAAASQSKREEWAQGFILKLQSGYTEGPVGFGLDAMAMLGLKLDSSPDRSGSGLLPRNTGRRAADDYSTLAPTAKARLGQTELRIGALNPTLPLMAANFSRLTPQLFNGAMLVSRDIDTLALTLGRIDQVKARDSANFEDLSVASMLGAYSAVQSDGMDYAGLDLQATPALTLSYHLSRLDDIYWRSFAGVQYSLPLGPGKAFADLRYFDARAQGRALAGEVDNRLFSSNLGYKLGGHTFSGGYQQSVGDTPFIYLNASDTYIFGELMVSNFAQHNEKAWLARYDYNFAALGVPGLSFSMRYVRGDEVDPQLISGPKAARLKVTGEEGHEWERDTDLIYTVQSGPLRDLSLRWRNAVSRSTFTDDADENRLIVSYQVKF